MRVCIVGASGKLGQYMVRHALERGYEVVGVCREQSAPKPDAFKDRITVVPGATDDRDVIKSAVSGCDGVLVPRGVHGYATGTAQAVLDFAPPGARSVFSCGWHITRDGQDVYSWKLKALVNIAGPPRTSRALRRSRRPGGGPAGRCRQRHALDRRPGPRSRGGREPGTARVEPARRRSRAREQPDAPRRLRAVHGRRAHHDELVHEAPAIVGRETPSALAITGSFADSCRDFTSHATKVGSQQGKDISRVEIHYTDGRVVEDETIDRPDYSLDGAAGGEIDFVLVKSGTTRERFDCSQENRPPTAVLEIKTPPVDQTVGHCFDFSFGGLAASSRPHEPTGRARPRFRTMAGRIQASSIGSAERSATPRCAPSRQLPWHQQQRPRRRHRELADRQRRRHVLKRKREHRSADRGFPRPVGRAAPQRAPPTEPGRASGSGRFLPATAGSRSRSGC